MGQASSSSWTRYGIALAAVALTLGVKLPLIPIITRAEPFLLFFAAVLVAAWFGGLGPGLLATALATVFNFYFFMPPYYEFGFVSLDQVPRLMLSVLEGICITLICTKLQAARTRVEERDREARELEGRIVEIADAEQRRIGFDLHDGLGQHLTGIALMTRRLQQRLSAAASPDADDASKISDLAKTAVEWTHDLCRSLAPPALETAGLAEALGELAAHAENIFHIECTFEENGHDESLDLAVSAHLYRISQEAISNAVRHGHAHNIRLRLAHFDANTTVQIVDDGTGIQPSVQSADGMGLRIMRYRAKMIGASIDIRRHESGGTVVACQYAPAGKRPQLSGSNDRND